MVITNTSERKTSACLIKKFFADAPTALRASEMNIDDMGLRDDGAMNTAFMATFI